MEIITEHKAEVAFPTSTLHFAKASEALPVQTIREDFSVEKQAPGDENKAKGPDMGE